MLSAIVNLPKLDIAPPPSFEVFFWNWQLVISTSEAEQLKAYFAKNAKALLDKGVIIEQVNGKKAQFSIAPADGSYKVNFGEGEFEAFFKAFLRPQMVELLFSK